MWSGEVKAILGNADCATFDVRSRYEVLDEGTYIKTSASD
jgi:hypothetical protein